MKQVVGPTLTAEPRRATARAVACPLAHDLELCSRHCPQYGGSNRDEPPAPDERSAGQARPWPPRDQTSDTDAWAIAIRPASREPRARGARSRPGDLA